MPSLPRNASQLRSAAAKRLPRSQTPSAALLDLLAPIEPPEASAPAGPKVVLLNDCRDQVNFGASVLVRGFFALLQRSLPNPQIVPIPSYWLMDLSGGTEAFIDSGRGMRPPSATFPSLADQFETVADQWLDGSGGPGVQDYLSRFEGADLVVLNGEGSIYRTNQSAIRELFLAWFAKVRLGIPTVFANGMVHLTDVVPVLPAMVHKTFTALDAVAVREPWSLRNLKAFYPEIEARLIPDSAFAFGPEVARDTSAVREIRARIGDAAYFCFDPGAMPMDHRLPHRSALYELIMALKRVVPVAVLVNSSPADTYIRRIATETDSVYVDTLEHYEEYMALVGDAQFVVTGRYHNPILAAIMGTASITFASANHKVHGTCEMLEGLSGVPYDGTYLLPRLAEIEQRARTLVADRDDTRAKLFEVCERRRSEVLELGELAARSVRRS